MAVYLYFALGASMEPVNTNIRENKNDHILLSEILPSTDPQSDTSTLDRQLSSDSSET